MSLITYVTKIHFAESVLEDALEAELELNGLMRPLVICDDGEGREGVVNRLLAAIPSHVSATLYRATVGHATEDTCWEASALYRHVDADGIIGFGGVEAISVAKGVAALVSHRDLPAQFAPCGGSPRLGGRVPPLVAIPTVESACAEAIGVAMVKQREGAGIALSNSSLTPRVVICDPSLTLDLPATRSASSGMDVLTHCLETFIATAYNPPADGIARDGIRRAVANLERVVADGSDLAARREMMAAALNGALAFQKGLGGVHAMSHALAGLGNGAADHGSVNAILLPVVLEFNAPAVPQRYSEIRRELGFSSRADLAEAFASLRERIGLPGGLGKVGFRRDDLREASTIAAAGYCNRTNPRHAGANDYHAMLLSAF